MFRNAKYRGIPCWFDESTNEIKGKNWLFDKLIEVNVWFDFEVLQIEELPIWVDIDDDDPNFKN